jgi:hypothetical protein
MLLTVVHVPFNWKIETRSSLDSTGIFELAIRTCRLRQRVVPSHVATPRLHLGMEMSCWARFNVWAFASSCIFNPIRIFRLFSTSSGNWPRRGFQYVCGRRLRIGRSTRPSSFGEGHNGFEMRFYAKLISCGPVFGFVNQRGEIILLR